MERAFKHPYGLVIRQDTSSGCFILFRNMYNPHATADVRKIKNVKLKSMHWKKSLLINNNLQINEEIRL